MPKKDAEKSAAEKDAGAEVPTPVQPEDNEVTKTSDVDEHGHEVAPEGAPSYRSSDSEEGQKIVAEERKRSFGLSGDDVVDGSAGQPIGHFGGPGAEGGLDRPERDEDGKLVSGEEGDIKGTDPWKSGDDS